MSWRDQLQPASFRGVAFHVRQSSGNFGRRTVLHEFPFRDVPYVEDMGRAARRFRIQGIVIGDDYMADRDRLIAAVEAEGPGKLIHPYLGELTVSVVDDGMTIDESTGEGGLAQISFTCIESGEAKFPAAQTATQDVVKARATTAQTALEGAFANRFSMAGLPSWAQASAIDRARGFLDRALSVVGALANASAARGAVLGLVDKMLPGLGSLLSNGFGFAESVLGLTSALRTGMAPREAIRALDTLGAFGDSTEVVITTTSIRRQEAANRDAIIELCQCACAIDRAIAAAETEFTDYQDAIAIRDSVTDRLDAIADSTLDDELFNALAGLRAAVVTDIAARGADLALRVLVTPPATVPALVLAYDLYEDAAREEEIVARNRVRHPGFLLAGNSLEVLADG